MKPEIPNKKNPEWHEPVDLEAFKDRTFVTLTILKYLLSYIAPQSGWADRLEALFVKHPDIDRRLMGYPENWRECPIWRDIEPDSDDTKDAFSKASPASEKVSVNYTGADNYTGTDDYTGAGTLTTKEGRVL
jgi:hypothetical protein